jgi:hypothetical protein
VVHVEHSAGPHLVIVGKFCRVCIACDLLVAHGADLSEVIGRSGVAGEMNPPSYVVLGTVDRRAWRQGLVRTVTLRDVRQCMADFSAYLRLDLTQVESKFMGRS